MIERETAYFSMEQIWRSGQCFRMVPEGENTFAVIVADRYLKAEQKGERCRFYCSEEEFENFWKEYFDLEGDYEGCISRIDLNDAYLTKAAQLGSGIRILKQDLWEMIVSFLISQQNNITRIRRCIENICTAYGQRRVSEDGKTYYAFPTPEVLAKCREEDLKACNLGYRSKYVIRTAESVVRGEIDLNTIRTLPYKKAKEELLRLYGVGEKVADCICLFGLHHLEAFPVDTHISQALAGHYKRGFPNRRYKGVQGIMQQYIFYYELFGEKEKLL